MGLAEMFATEETIEEGAEEFKEIFASVSEAEKKAKYKQFMNGFKAGIRELKKQLKGWDSLDDEERKSILHRRARILGDIESSLNNDPHKNPWQFGFGLSAYLYVVNHDMATTHLRGDLYAVLIAATRRLKQIRGFNWNIVLKSLRNASKKDLSIEDAARLRAFVRAVAA